MNRVGLQIEDTAKAGTGHGLSIRARSSARAVALVGWLVVSAGCGGLTMGREDGAVGSDGGYVGDGGRPPNGRYCSTIIPGMSTQIDDPARPLLEVWMCAPDMPPGTPCTWRGTPNRGTCRDFVAESNGYYAEYARQNRVPRYCWPPEVADPCFSFTRGNDVSDCAFRAHCVPIPMPRPGGPQHMCLPEPCN